MFLLVVLCIVSYLHIHFACFLEIHSLGYFDQCVPNICQIVLAGYTRNVSLSVCCHLYVHVESTLIVHLV